MKIVSKSRLMSTNRKASRLTKVFTDQSKIVHNLSKIKMSRLAKDLAVMQELENEDVLVDSLLD